jgi:plasmid replication initiation protein
MSNELSLTKPETTEIVNTPETLGVTPRYVLQHNAVSRGSDGLSSTARKLAAMAMALIPPDLSSRTAEFTFADFCNAVGFERGGESYKIFRAAVHECMMCTISVETEPDEKGKKQWKEYTWFSVSEYDEKTEIARMTFSSELAGFLAALKWMYSKVPLKDLGELQSRYAIHLFTMAMSFKSLAGRGGNSPGSWYFQRDFPDDIRKVMGVKRGAYKNNSLLKQKVIDKPVQEINEANLGFEITPVPVKKGQRIVAIRFNCKNERRRAVGKDKNVEAPALPEQSRNEILREEKELAHLKELYPDEFAARYTAAIEEMPESWKERDAGKTLAESRALFELKEIYGIRK